MTIVHVEIGDTATVFTVRDASIGGAVADVSFEIPCGVISLGARHLAADPPLPEELTNAIGEMMDHIDDVKRELPDVVDASVTIAGQIPRVMATVEVGTSIAGDEFVLHRDAAEDVFRTLATESEADRRHNPGLPSDLVGVVVGGCCVVIGLIRGLQLDGVTVMMNPLP